ncbi:MAG TPA: ABC-type transport auxiliary lipoprotein family protein [Burkholderiaceae bacterium]|nr:ABC-type transport auxiliary lipoprotein family protein [Burkholderiaceae bacterium]
MHGLKTTATFLMAGLLGACASSKPSQYYTLLPPPATSQAVPEQAQDRPKFAISVEPVQVPEQVDRPQIVVSDPNSTQVVPLNGSLWASPVADELRNALSDGITRRLGVLDVALAGAPDTLPVWRIGVRVQRFDSLYGERALIDATWRLSPVHQPGKKTRLCRAEARAAVGEGMSALVAGHQAAVDRLAAAIAGQLNGTEPTNSDGLLFKGCTFY